MKPSSAKNKGRKLQQWVRDCILKHFKTKLEPDDVKSTSMGAGGEDVQLSPAARKLFPYAIECKNVERVNIWQSYAQANTHGKHEPLLIVKKNHHKPLAIVDAEYFVKLHKEKKK